MTERDRLCRAAQNKGGGCTFPPTLPTGRPPTLPVCIQTLQNSKLSRIAKRGPPGRGRARRARQNAVLSALGPAAARRGAPRPARGQGEACKETLENQPRQRPQAPRAAEERAQRVRRCVSAPMRAPEARGTHVRLAGAQHFWDPPRACVPPPLSVRLRCVLVTGTYCARRRPPRCPGDRFAFCRLNGAPAAPEQGEPWLRAAVGPKPVWLAAGAALGGRGALRAAGGHHALTRRVV